MRPATSAAPRPSLCYRIGRWTRAVLLGSAACVGLLLKCIAAPFYYAGCGIVYLWRRARWWYWRVSGRSGSYLMGCDAKETASSCGRPVCVAIKSPASPAKITSQTKLGPQSHRGGCPGPIGQFNVNAHSRDVYFQMIENERVLCGEYCVFYHSYNHSAVLYAVHAALASIVHGYHFDIPPLPRLVDPGPGPTNATALASLISSTGTRDHARTFRAKAICATVSLQQVDGAAEACPSSVFSNGYSCTDVDFLGLLQGVLAKSGVASPSTVAQSVLTICAKAGLVTNSYRPGSSRRNTLSGHMLQIFVRREIVDDYVYASHAFGVLDAMRMPLSTYLGGDQPKAGQVRILLNSKAFLDPNAFRVFPFAAKPEHMTGRRKLREDLIRCLRGKVPDPCMQIPGLDYHPDPNPTPPTAASDTANPKDTTVPVPTVTIVPSTAVTEVVHPGAPGQGQGQGGRRGRGRRKRNRNRGRGTSSAAPPPAPPAPLPAIHAAHEFVGAEPISVC